MPAFTLAIAVVTWYAGGGPSALAVVLSALSFNFFFTDPVYTLYVAVNEIPYYFIFVAWALIIAVFAAVRRRAERDLLEARDHLQAANKNWNPSPTRCLTICVRHCATWRATPNCCDGRRLRARREEQPLPGTFWSRPRMGALIDDLLAFSRIGRAETNKTVVRLDQLVDEVVTELRQDAAGREITWRTTRETWSSRSRRSR